MYIFKSLKSSPFDTDSWLKHIDVPDWPYKVTPLPDTRFDPAGTVSVVSHKNTAVGVGV